MKPRDFSAPPRGQSVAFTLQMQPPRAVARKKGKSRENPVGADRGAQVLEPRMNSQIFVRKRIMTATRFWRGGSRFQQSWPGAGADEVWFMFAERLLAVGVPGLIDRLEVALHRFGAVRIALGELDRTPCLAERLDEGERHDAEVFFLPDLGRFLGSARGEQGAFTLADILQPCHLAIEEVERNLGALARGSLFSGGET